MVGSKAGTRREVNFVRLFTGKPPVVQGYSPPKSGEYLAISTVPGSLVPDRVVMAFAFEAVSSHIQVGKRRTILLRNFRCNVADGGVRCVFCVGCGFIMTCTNDDLHRVHRFQHCPQCKGAISAFPCPVWHSFGVCDRCEIESPPMEAPPFDAVDEGA